MKNVILRSFLFFILGITSVMGQMPIEKYSVGLKGYLFIFTDLSMGAEINTFSPSYVYSVNYNHLERSEGLFSGPSDELNQVNVLFGKYHDSTNKKFRVQYQAGLGYVWGTIKTGELIDRGSLRFDDNVMKDFNTLGVPLRIGVRYIPFNFLAIGIDITANLNKEKSVISPLLSLEIGKLRSSP